jgi:hypothetical protein
MGGTIPSTGRPDSDVQKVPTVARRAQPAASPLEGSWLVKQDCTQGKFEIEIKFSHTSPTEFTGDSIGITTGARSRIVDGRINGNRVTFTRQAGPLADRWTAQLKGPTRFSGTSAGPAWRCSYTAARK